MFRVLSLLILVVSLCLPVLAEAGGGFIPSDSAVGGNDLGMLKTSLHMDKALLPEQGGMTIAGKGKNEKLGLALPSCSMYTYVLDIDAAVDAGVLSVTGGYTKDKSVIIQEYSLIREVGQGDNKKRYGVGMRMVVVVDEDTANLDVSGIPSIAAKVEAGKLEAEVSLKVMGISGEKVNAAMPALPAELNFTTLTQIYTAFGKIRELIYDDSVTVTIRELARVKKAK